MLYCMFTRLFFSFQERVRKQSESLRLKHFIWLVDYGSIPDDDGVVVCWRHDCYLSVVGADSKNPSTRPHLHRQVKCISVHQHYCVQQLDRKTEQELVLVGSQLCAVVNGINKD